MHAACVAEAVPGPRTVHGQMGVCALAPLPELGEAVARVVPDRGPHVQDCVIEGISKIPSLHTKKTMLLLIIVILIFSVLMVIVGVTFHIKRREDFINSIDLQAAHESLIKRYKLQGNTGATWLSDVPIYYINLDRHSDRRDFMESQKQLYGLSTMQRVPGVDARDLDMGRPTFDLGGWSRRVVVENGFKSFSPAEIACTLSHVKAIHTAFTRGDTVALIVEDDASFAAVPFWKTSLSDILDKAPKGWGIVSIFSNTLTLLQRMIPFKSGMIGTGTVAYIISRSGMEDVLRNLTDTVLTIKQQQPIILNVTADYWIFRRTPFYIYTTHRLIYTFNDQGDMNSTIHTDHTDIHIKNSKHIVAEYM